jgi:hypothetical protein
MEITDKERLDFLEYKVLKISIWRHGSTLYLHEKEKRYHHYHISYEGSTAREAIDNAIMAMREEK